MTKYRLLVLFKNSFIDVYNIYIAKVQVQHTHRLLYKNALNFNLNFLKILQNQLFLKLYCQPIA